jgi:hypothetical protein
MANSGGGKLVFGVGKNGDHIGIVSSLLQTFDPANISNKLRSFTGARIDASYREIQLAGKVFGFLIVRPASRLIVFESDGNYQASDGKQGRAFIKGVVYTRVPGSTREAEQLDLDLIIDRLVQIKLSAVLARIETVARTPLESDVIITDPADASKGSVVGTSTPVTLIPQRPNPETFGNAPVAMRFAPHDSKAIPIFEIADPTAPFSSMDLELQTQVRLWKNSHGFQRIPSATLHGFYLHRAELTISSDAAELCFMSATVARGFPFFWASRIDPATRREVMKRELMHAKSPMTEVMPFVVCAFEWELRKDLLSQPNTKALRKLKARNIVAKLLKFDKKEDFIRRSKKGATYLDLDEKRYAMGQLFSDRQVGHQVFERIVQLHLEGKADDKLKSFGQRLDLLLHADST